MKTRCVTVKIINASTGTPFPEHKDSDKRVYAEVEPGVEYHIKITNHRNKASRMYVNLDGEELCRFTLSAGGSKTIKSYEVVEDGAKTHHSMIFEEPPRDAQTDTESIYHWWTGVIAVEAKDASKSKYAGSRKSSIPSRSGWSGGKVVKSQTKSKSKGAMTKAGNVLKSTKVTTGYTTYTHYLRYGRDLKTVTLRYCTTIGLIEAGILPRPKTHEMTWELARRMNPATRTQALVEPTIVTHKGDGNILQDRTYEVFDLSNLESSSDEEMMEASDEIDDNGTNNKLGQEEATGDDKEEITSGDNDDHGLGLETTSGVRVGIKQEEGVPIKEEEEEVSQDTEPGRSGHDQLPPTAAVSIKEETSSQ